MTGVVPPISLDQVGLGGSSEVVPGSVIDTRRDREVSSSKRGRAFLQLQLFQNTLPCACCIQGGPNMGELLISVTPQGLDLFMLGQPNTGARLGPGLGDELLSEGSLGAQEML